MSYSAAYCVKCRTHTDTVNRETVILANKSRALKGECPVCNSENYRFLPPKEGSKFPIGQGRTAVQTLLPTTMVTQNFSHQLEWVKWMVYSFFVMSCVVFGYVLSLRY